MHGEHVLLLAAVSGEEGASHRAGHGALRLLCILQAQGRLREMHRHARRHCFLRVACLLLSLSVTSCQAEIATLTDKTFDHVREAFSYPSTLILWHSSDSQLLDRSANKRAIAEFSKLPDDQLLRGKGILLATVDAGQNRMLAARMGVLSKELPCLIFLSNDRVFRYRGDPPSAQLMRSYALQGYLNQGDGEALRNKSIWLWLNWEYLDYGFNGGKLTPSALILLILFGGFAVGLSIIVMVVLHCTREEGKIATNGKKEN